MTTPRKIFYNIAAGSGTKILSTAIGLVAVGVMMRYLGPQGYGDYAYVMVFFGLFLALADLGVYPILTREFSRPGADESSVIGRVFTLRLLTSGVLMLMFVPITMGVLWWGGRSWEIVWSIPFVGVAFFCSSCYGALNGIFQKKMLIDQLGVIELGGKMLQVILVFVAVSAGAGMIAIVGTLAAAMVWNCVFVLWRVRRLIPSFHLQIDRIYWRQFLGYSTPLGVAAVVTFLYLNTDVFLLYNLLPTEEARHAVGIYTGGYKVITNLVFFPAMVAGIMLPLLSHAFSKDHIRFALLCDKTIHTLLIFIIPLAIGTFIFAKDIIMVVGGSAYTESAQVLKITIFALVAMFFGNLFNNILLSANLQKKIMLTLIVALVYSVISNIFLIPHFGYIAAAWTAVGTEIIVAVSTFLMILRHTHYRPCVPHLPQFFVSGGAMAVTALFLYNLFPFPWGFLLAGTTSVLVYIIMIFFLRVITTSDLKVIFMEKSNI